MEFSDEQKGVVDAISQGSSILVTGPAGSGKTTILQHLRETYGAGMALTASTGIAAVHVQGTTLHSWAGLGISDMTGEQLARQIIARRNKPLFRILSTKILAIDEISMIGGPLLDKIDQVFRIVREVDAPFGGMQLVMFGDFLQLPPVAKSLQEKQKLFAFQSDVWREAKIKVAQLTKVYRQADPRFAEALSSIRVGEPTQDAYDILRERLAAKDESTDIRPVIVHTHNADVDQTNIDELAKLDGPEMVYRSKDEYDDQGAMEMLRKNCLAPEQLKLKVGAQVMLLKNVNPMAGFANGSIGTVVSLGREIVVKFSNGNLGIDTHKWEISVNNEVVAEREQYPLRLAYAITSHKSQGMSLDKIRVFLGKVFEYGQTYVALSRARTQQGLFIGDGGRQSIRAHPDAVRFYRECGA